MKYKEEHIIDNLEMFIECQTSLLLNEINILKDTRLTRHIMCNLLSKEYGDSKNEKYLSGRFLSLILVQNVLKHLKERI